MTIEEAINFLKGYLDEEVYTEKCRNAHKMAIKALEQEPRKDEVILTKEEYGELVSSEFDNGYTKGYSEALEQNDVLDEIRAEIEQVSFTHYFEYGEYYGEDSRQERIVNFDTVIQIIDKYKTESEK